jgi:hypothetical protein
MTTPEEKIKALEEQVATLTKSKKDVEIELKLALSREEKLKENYSIAVARHFRSSTQWVLITHTLMASFPVNPPN